MERTNILIKIFLALCFYNFLNNHLYGYETIDYKLNVNYCIRKEKSNSNGKSKNKNQISESNIEKGLKMISERSCIVFLKKSSCEEKKKICKKECSEKSKKSKGKKKSKKKDCKKTCTSEVVTKSFPFIEFLYDKDSNTKDYNFNGSVSLMRTVEYEMKINEMCNKNPGCVARKVLMYLGLIPTVRRYDRLNFVSVDYKQIKNEFIEQYNIVDSPLYLNYDFSSIAHWSQYYGSASKQATFTVDSLKLADDAITGQEYRPAFSDFKWLYYAHCEKDPFYSIKCNNGGYPKSESSSECECPTGFSGETCDKLEKSDGGCYKSPIFVTPKKLHILRFKGKKTCNILLSSLPNTRIVMTIYNLTCQTKTPCFENDCLQIKYQKDMALTGLCLCGKKNKEGLTSHSNQTVIRYTGSNFNSSVVINFYSINGKYKGNEYDINFPERVC